MKLYRPYIDVETRCRVALKQLGTLWIDEEIAHNRPDFTVATVYRRTLSKFLASSLKNLAPLLACEVGDLELHHRPALVNRQKYVRAGKTHYDPPANSVDHLFYLSAAAHDIETRVRGLNGQHSDLALARKRKRKERKAAQPKRKWPPSRPTQGASRWPKQKALRS